MADDSLRLKEEMEYHPCDTPRGMKYYLLSELTAEQQTKLNDLKIETIREDEKYLAAHPEIRAIIIILLRLVLRHRPIIKIHEFIAKYFTQNQDDILEEIRAYIKSRDPHVYEGDSAVLFAKREKEKKAKPVIERPSDYVCAPECICRGTIEDDLKEAFAPDAYLMDRYYTIDSEQGELDTYSYRDGFAEYEGEETSLPSEIMAIAYDISTRGEFDEDLLTEQDMASIAIRESSQEEKPDILVEEPRQEEKQEMTFEEPKQEEKPDVAVEEPKQKEKQEMTVEEPKQEEKPDFTVEDPKQEEKPDVTVEEPRQEERLESSLEEPKPGITVEEPMQEEKPNIIVEVPMQEAPEIAVEEPKQETPEMAVEELKQEDKPAQEPKQEEKPAEEPKQAETVVEPGYPPIEEGAVPTET